MPVNTKLKLTRAATMVVRLVRARMWICPLPHSPTLLSKASSMVTSSLPASCMGTTAQPWTYTFTPSCSLGCSRGAARTRRCRSGKRDDSFFPSFLEVKCPLGASHEIATTDVSFVTEGKVPVGQTCNQGQQTVGQGGVLGTVVQAHVYIFSVCMLTKREPCTVRQPLVATLWERPRSIYST